MTKISIVTAVYNREETISDCLSSIDGQTLKPFEHIVIDGKSQDSTLAILNAEERSYRQVFSEPDSGIYDAINKGIGKCRGEIIGVLHSDDLFAGEDIIEKVSNFFEANNCDLIYGDLCYVRKNDTSKTVRYWKAGEFDVKNLKLGWMPPHPTVFFRASLLRDYGFFNASYKISADYDWLLRILSQNFSIGYLPSTLVKMRVGGASNKMSQLFLKIKEDVEIANLYFRIPFLVIFLKNIRKIQQFSITERRTR